MIGRASPTISDIASELAAVSVVLAVIHAIVERTVSTIPTGSNVCNMIIPLNVATVELESSIVAGLACSLRLTSTSCPFFVLVAFASAFSLD